MTDYVVDTSILIQGFITDIHSARAKTLIFSVVGKSNTAHILNFGRVECVNILWKRVRFNNLPLADAESILDNIKATPLRIHDEEPYLHRALQIAAAQELAAYDSVYLALAEDLGFALITDDSKQAQAAIQMGLTVKPITDFAEQGP
jgi:predicted nucleic acid-binding protein